MVDELFHLENADALRAEIGRLGLAIPVVDEFSVLREPMALRDKRVSNRLCVQPMEGADATPDGAPGAMTFRRYLRYARGGFGMIWVEATAVRRDARANPAQLCLHHDNVHAFAQLVHAIREAARESRREDIVLLIQLTHPGRRGGTAPVIVHHYPDADRKLDIPADYPLASDSFLDGLRDTYVEAARLAAEAGFDGIDVKSCHGDLTAELLAAFTRTGRYGSSFENRTRFLRETLAEIRTHVPKLLLATRTTAYDGNPQPYGFGVTGRTGRESDLREPIELVRMLRDAGVDLVNVSVSPPPAVNGEPRHPLWLLDRQLAITRKLHESVPDLPVLGGGFSWLRQLVPNVAAAVLGDEGMAVAGLGRGALGYPDAPRDLFDTGKLDPTKCCIMCDACYELIGEGALTGCVIRDSDVYGPEYRHRKRYSIDCLREDARRCHGCAAAMCTAACPNRIDVPAFVRAFADGDSRTAYGIVRRANVLPEMCSHLCPTWMQCEGACVENALSGNPVRIRDIQYAVSWSARADGLTAVKLPDLRTGKRVAVVGGGPAGIACAVGLLEKGHGVVIVERGDRLGGTPEEAIRAGRFPSAQPEIEAVLQRALSQGALEIRHEQALGIDVALDELRDRFDAVLLAAGVRQEQSLGRAEGVVDALTFLQETKGGHRQSLPARVAILAGGDCAMDAAAVSKELGATDIYVVYAGSLAEMHWHMPDGWFGTSGAHVMTLTRALGYATDASGTLTGVRIRRTEYGDPDDQGVRALTDIAGSESLLRVGLAIEAMGLHVSDALRECLDGVAFTEHGLVRVAGDGSLATSLENVFAAGGLINGGASVAQCIAEGMAAAQEIDKALA